MTGGRQIQVKIEFSEVVAVVPDLVFSKEKRVIHVLHVDDDPSILEISRQILLDMDGSLKIDHACCVDEAFKKLSTVNYEVIVSDYEMPQKNGLQFLKELRERNNEIQFILFAGKGREEVAIKAKNLGADGYINKHGTIEVVYCELLRAIKLSVNLEKTKARFKCWKGE
jgi:DNA-binding NarL/FixJ family response regulator